MADQKKITSLPAGVAIQDADIFVAVQGLVTKQPTALMLSTYANSKLPTNVGALGTLVGSADKLPYFSGAGALSLATLTAFARTLLDDADAATAQTTLGIPALIAAANAATATKLATSRTISATGDASWSVSFDGSANATAALTLAASGVTAATYGSVTVNAKGLVTAATTATPIANGGTAATTAAAARTNLGLGTAAVAAILGTVSQASGVPTGAIVETGSNANGRYTKFADGTLICTGASASTYTPTTASGGIYYIGTAALTFPVAFIAAPTITYSPDRGSAYFSWTAPNNSPTTTQSGAVYLMSLSNTAIAGISYIAIGRWF